MKKVILIIVFTLILSGCSVKYNLELESDLINDNIEISGNKEKYIEYTKDNQNVEYISDILYRIGDGRTNFLQEKMLIDNNIVYKFNGSIEYNETEFLAPFSNWCYEDVSMFKENNIVTLTTTNKFLCYDLYDELENVEINVISKYKVLENNADKVDNNKYTWYINRNNKDNKTIFIKIDKSQKDNFVSENKDGISIYVKYLLEIFVVLVLIVIIIKKMHRTSNKNN